MPTLTDDDLQDLAQEEEGGAKFVFHIDPLYGADSGLGKSWQSPVQTFAYAIAQAKASFPSKFTCMRFNGPVVPASGRIVFQDGALGPVRMRGIGRYASVTGSVANGPTIWANSACEFINFSIVSTAVASYNYLIGDALASVQGVLMNSLRGIGTTDGTYFTGTGSSYDLEDSVISSQWDTHYHQGAGIIARIRRCSLFSLGPHQIAGVQNVQGAGQSVSGALTQISDTRISFRATDSNVARTAYGLHTQGGGRVELSNVTLLCEVPDGKIVDCEADSPSEIVIGGDCSVNLARSLQGSTGTISYSFPSVNVREINDAAAVPIQGPGPYPMIVHAQDSHGAAILRAMVTITDVAGPLFTDSSGNVALALPAGGAEISAWAAGYDAIAPIEDSISAGSWTSSGSATRVVTLSVIPFLPAPAGEVTARLYTLEPDGVTPLPRASVTFEMIDPKANGPLAMARVPYVVVSDANGLLQTFLKMSSTYRVRFGDLTVTCGPWAEFDTPSSGTLDLPNVLGSIGR